MMIALLTRILSTPLKEKQWCQFGLTGELVYAKSASVQKVNDKTHKESQAQVAL